jgi:1-deoxy-D-xylulose-5-phosphate synthase
VLQDGLDVAIFGLGAMMGEAKRLAEMLEAQGLSVAVINPRFAKPVDRACVLEYGSRCGLLITMEDHVLAGGFGSAVLENVNELELAVPVVRVGWPDEFIEHGKTESLREKYGLTAEGALEKAGTVVRELLAARLVAR